MPTEAFHGGDLSSLQAIHNCPSAELGREGFIPLGTLLGVIDTDYNLGLIPPFLVILVKWHSYN